MKDFIGYFQNHLYLKIRGNISIILNHSRLVVIDHERKVLQTLWPKDFSMSDEEIEKEISIALNTPIKSPPEYFNTFFYFIELIFLH